MKRTGQSKIAVVGWGRGMGHTGHMYLADAVIQQAKDMNADPYFFVSKTVGKDDPIFPEEKVRIYQKVFPQHATIFEPQGNLNQALTDLAGLGYQGVVVVVGADQKQAFQYLVNPNKEGVPVYQTMGLKKLKVISRQETRSQFAHEEGPRATPMREILLDPNASEEDKFKVWRRDMPEQLGDRDVLDIMNKAESRMLHTPAKQSKVKQMSQKATKLKEATQSQKDDSVGYMKYFAKPTEPNKPKEKRFHSWDEYEQDKNPQKQPTPELAEGVQCTPNEVAELLYNAKPEIFTKFGDEFVMDAITQACEQHTGSAQEVAVKVVDILKQGIQESEQRRTMGLDASLDQHFNDKKHLLNPGVAHRGQLVTIIKAPRMLDLLPGETFEVSSSDADGVTLKHGMGTKFDNVKFPHGTYKILNAQGLKEGVVYNTLNIDNQNLIDQKAKSKPDGLYTFRGIMFRVRNGRVTHYAAEGTILVSYGNFNSAVGSYDTRDEAKAKLKSIKEGVTEAYDGFGKFDAAEFSRHMEKLRAREELRKTDPVRALVGDLKDQDAEKAAAAARRKKPEDDSIGINDPRHPGYAYTQAGQHTVDEGEEDALAYATKAHAGQTRSGGDPYITHPMRVADHIRQYKQSHNLDALISAAYLHDTIEDTSTTQEALHDLFGGLVASLVQELTSDPEQIKKMGKKHYLAHKMAAMSSYALVIKLADRLDNVKDITTAKTPEWRHKYAQETAHILDYIEKTRALSGTHRKLIELIRAKLAEIDNPPQVADEGITRRGILKGIAGAGAVGAAGKASAIAGAFPTPSAQQAMYKAAADSNRAEAKRQAELKAKADSERLEKNTQEVDREQRVNHHKLDEFAPGNGDDGIPHAEYQVYQCNPKDQFEWIGGPLYQTDSMGMAHKYAYEMYLKHRPKAFMVWQAHTQGSRGNYGVKGESDHDESELKEDSQLERKITRVQSMIQDFHNRAKATKNDIKKNHYLQMADQLQTELDRLINDANEQERDGNMVAQHDSESSDTWNRGGLAEDYIDEK